MESQSETTQTVSALKLPVLKTREYDLWSMRMEQYLTFTDPALWEVIVNGDSVSLIASASASADGPIPPKTAEQKLARKNELKVKITLMLAIPDEHLLKFHTCKDAKSSWEVIKNSQEGLDKTYDRFQKLISQLKIHGEVVSPEDANLKLLRKIDLNSQISAKDKASLGYDSQINESEVVHSMFNSRESDVDDIPVNDRFKTGKGFHAVLAPYTGNYMPSRPDLSFARLDDSIYKNKVSETKTIISKTSKDIIENPKTIRPSAPIIEEWDTNSDNVSVFRPKSDQTKPKFTKIIFFKSGENVKSVNKENTHRQVEYPRKSQSPKDNRRNWNGMMTQKLGNGFESIKKACFVCGSLNQLIKDYDFHENKMVEKPVLNNKGRVTAVATKSGQVPVNAAKQSSPRAATSISTARPVNTAAPKPKVNDALPITYSYFKAHSLVKRAFNQKSAAKTNKFNEKVNTARVNNVTTIGPKVVVGAAVGNRENAVKSSTCWIWRPIGNVINHTSKDSGSYMLKRFDYGNPQYTLQDQGIFDSGCSRHMTRNKSFLTDYQEIDGGFVAFGGSPKGGKITGKASISSARLVNTAAPKPKVNDALPTTYSYFKAHSPVRRAFNQKSAAKTNKFNEKVNTARVNNVTTAGPKAVVSAAVGNRENAVKSSACWIWRPTRNVIDHTSKDSGSYMFKRFDYVDLQGRLKCSRNMTENKSFLANYQEVDGGFVAFVGSPKGGKITRKEAECLVLSPDFKLLNESQVLLKVHRQNNMYSFDLKNVVPLEGLTCLFAKATIDESNL
ncbi:hypothetical protein Tco_0828652 [Tanacetum coccineum]